MLAIPGNLKEQETELKQPLSVQWEQSYLAGIVIPTFKDSSLRIVSQENKADYVALIQNTELGVFKADIANEKSKHG